MKSKPKNWIEYELIDCGNGMKLEAFGENVLIRPEPKALWRPSMSNTEWEKMAHAAFIQSSSNSGKWEKLKAMKDEWGITYTIDARRFNFKLRLTRFKHVGVFPEQAVNWDYILSHLNRNHRFINLFAYTGAASIFAKHKEADVLHVDSIKQVINWSKENMELNGLSDIRWVLEDAMKFVKREERRGNSYDFILMDPPSFGHGPKGEKWQLAERINDLLSACSSILKKNGRLIWNNYSLGLSEFVVENLLRDHFREKSVSTGELYLEDRFNKKLSMGVYGMVE